ELKRLWDVRVGQPAAELMHALVNASSQEEIRRLHSLIPPLYDIAQEPVGNLVELRNQVREFWTELAIERSHVGTTGMFGSNRVAFLLDKWSKHYALDSEGYIVFWQSGTFFPTQRNFRGTIARILADKSRYLATCPRCNQYFIKSRDD